MRNKMMLVVAGLVMSSFLSAQGGVLAGNTKPGKPGGGVVMAPHPDLAVELQVATDPFDSTIHKAIRVTVKNMGDRAAKGGESLCTTTAPQTDLLDAKVNPAATVWLTLPQYEGTDGNGLKYTYGLASGGELHYTIRLNPNRIKSGSKVSVTVDPYAANKTDLNRVNNAASITYK